MYLMCLSSIDISCMIIALSMILILVMQVCIHSMLFERINDVHDTVISIIENTNRLH
jgi:hypothetical protein